MKRGRGKEKACNTINASFHLYVLLKVESLETVINVYDKDFCGKF